MSAKDYIIQIGCFGTPYLAKKIKSKKLMSLDRREIQESEILGLFENYLREWTSRHPDDTLIVTNGGKKVFEAKLLDND